MKKYLVIGGNVQSKSDGQMHYITAVQLCNLYKVNPDECVMRESIDYYNGNRINSFDKLKILQPRYDGNYRLTT